MSRHLLLNTSTILRIRTYVPAIWLRIVQGLADEMED